MDARKKNENTSSWRSTYKHISSSCCTTVNHTSLQCLFLFCRCGLESKPSRISQIFTRLNPTVMGSHFPTGGTMVWQRTQATFHCAYVNVKITQAQSHPAKRKSSFVGYTWTRLNIKATVTITGYFKLKYCLVLRTQECMVDLYYSPLYTGHTGSKYPCNLSFV